MKTENDLSELGIAPVDKSPGSDDWLIAYRSTPSYIERERLHEIYKQMPIDSELTKKLGEIITYNSTNDYYFMSMVLRQITARINYLTGITL